MKKIFTATIIALTLGAGVIVSATDASAQYRRRGPGIAPLIGGLAVGAIIGGAIANSRPAYAYPPGYYAPGPGYGPAPVEYYDEPVCQIQPQQYWDGYGWRVRNVQVCN